MDEKKDVAEIEITPEMVTAGVAAFYDYDDRFEPVEMAVVRILQAAISTRSTQGTRLVLGVAVAAALAPYLGTAAKA